MLNISCSAKELWLWAVSLFFFTYLVQGADIPQNVTESDALLCEEKSEHWNERIHNESEATCERLQYNKQYCLIEDKKELECLQQRAVMHDLKSCDCFKGNLKYSEQTGCLYVEICTFIDPNFECDKEYRCTVDKNDAINCTAPDRPFYTNHCRSRGLMYCPAISCYIANFETQYFNVFKDECGDNLTDVFGTNATIYVIDQVHFENKSHGFGSITALILAEGDEGNRCVKTGVSYHQRTPTSTLEDWKIVVPALSGFILIMLISYGCWKFRRDRIRENKTLDELLDNRFEYVRKIMHDEPSERAVDASTGNAEVPEPISLGDIELPDENQDPTEVSGDEPLENEPGEEDAVIESESSRVSDSACRKLLHSYANSSYTNDKHARPSLSSMGSAVSGYSNKSDLGTVEPFNDEASETSSVVSGYSFKSSLTQNGSVGRSSGFDFPLTPQDRQFEATQLLPIHEGSICDRSDARLIQQPYDGENPEMADSSLISNSDPQGEVSNLCDPQSRLHCGPLEMNNPTYLS